MTAPPFFRPSKFRRRLLRLVRPLPPSTVSTAVADRCFQLLELVGLFDLYELVTNALSPRLRPLSPRECDLLRPLFGRSIPYHRISIDEAAWIGPRDYGICYVSFHTVNSWGGMSDATLVHEIVHVWQYLHRGALYIPRALAAQRTAAGYNYGGLRGLLRAGSLDDFNYEQMAAVVEDYYRLRVGLPARYLPESSPLALRELARLSGLLSRTEYG